MGLKTHLSWVVNKSSSPGRNLEEGIWPQHTSAGYHQLKERPGQARPSGIAVLGFTLQAALLVVLRNMLYLARHPKGKRNPIASFVVLIVCSCVQRKVLSVWCCLVCFSLSFVRSANKSNSSILLMESYDIIISHSSIKQVFLFAWVSSLTSKEGF